MHERILYLHRTQGRGAEGVHISSMVREWRKAGHSVDVLSPPGVDPASHAGEKPVDKSEFRTSGVETAWKFISTRFPQWSFEIFEILYNLYSIPSVLSAIRKAKPSFLYERYAFFHFAGAVSCVLTGIPLFLEVNEVSDVKRARAQTFVRLCGYLERRIFGCATRIFTVSSYLRERIDGRVPQADVVVMPNAVDAAIIGRKTRRGEIRDRYGLGKSIVLGFAGWFDAWDRLDLLIEAYAELRKSHDVSVLLIGDGKIRPTLEEQVRLLSGDSRVVFTGPVARDEIFDYMDAVDIPVLPHSNDFGSPVVLFEFMSLGKTVIAPELPPICDVLRDRRNGLLFPPLDLERLRSAIELLIVDERLRKALGEAARADVAAKHTWSANAKGIIEAWENAG